MELLASRLEGLPPLALVTGSGIGRGHISSILSLDSGPLLFSSRVSQIHIPMWLSHSLSGHEDGLRGDIPRKE